MINKWWSQWRTRKQRKAIMEEIRKATAQGQCVILTKLREGLLITVCGKDHMTTQLEEIAKEKGVRL